MCCKADSHCIFYNLFIQHRKRSRHTGTYRTGMGIGSATERCGTAAEYFRLRGKLYMNFQTDDGFILFCHNKYLSVSALFLYISDYIPDHPKSHKPDRIPEFICTLQKFTNAVFPMRFPQVSSVILTCSYKLCIYFRCSTSRSAHRYTLHGSVSSL